MGLALLKTTNSLHLGVGSKEKVYSNRDIRKVMKTQHEYPEFGHTQGEIKKKPAKKYISIQGGGGETQKTINFDGSWVSLCLSFFLSASSAYIDFQCSYLHRYYNSSRMLCIKCWDSAFRTEFQHFILRFNKISLLYSYWVSAFHTEI